MLVASAPREHSRAEAIVSSRGLPRKALDSRLCGGPIRARGAARRRLDSSASAGILTVSVSALELILAILLAAAVCVALARRQAPGRRGRHRDEEHQREQRLRDELKAISLDVLAQTGDLLARRLEDQTRAQQERGAGELAKRSEEIKGLVRPVEEKLGRMENEIGRLERERRQAQGELAQMLRNLGDGLGTLRTETGNLVTALRRPSTRGSWGEIQLRNVVEMAGMVAHCDFLEQSTIDGDDGALRPDMLVRLPGAKLVVVDSKVPLDAYLSALEATLEHEREQHLERHARQAREHIAKLAGKAYQSQLQSTPEFVVMFVPSDGIYQAALAQDPALIEYGVKHQVLMATPTTLIGLLWAVHYGWRQELIAESAREIADSARELHRRLGRFIEPLAKVGRQLDSSVKAYNEAVGSFDHRVVPQVRRIELAGAASDPALTAPPALESSARVPRARLASEGDADETERAASEAQLTAATPSLRAIKTARDDAESASIDGLASSA
ncbi:MAG: DNA recombination protein RmuC [Actinobacteria bacterium]|nr:MAG: DNA recombination protein RmuC [Actinomycetota bacterium]